MNRVDAVDAVADRLDAGVVGVAGAELVPISLLMPGSPRLLSEDAEHVQHLVMTTTPMPPIMVHRRSMQVIDDMHRLQAALVRGD